MNHMYLNLKRREGKGMKPRVESGATRTIQTGSIINPNNGPPKKNKFYQNLKQNTLDNISELYVDFYMELWQMTQTRKATRVQRWTNASRLNWNAGIYMMKTYFTRKPTTVSSLQFKMHITRTSARKIISDMYGEGWITQHQIEGDKRKLGYIVTDVFYKNWEQYVTVLINKSELQDWQQTYNMHHFACKHLDNNMDT